MCAEADKFESAPNALSDSNAPLPLNEHSFAGVTELMRTALDELQASLKSRKVDAICASYRNLRTASRGLRVKDMFDMADRELGKGTTHTIISAFSHLHCYMCNDGTTPCEHCEGEGKIGQGLCPPCEGLGVATCGFCRGTGWADRSLIPNELRRPVLDLQIAHLRNDMKRFSDLQKDLTHDKVSAMHKDKRLVLLGWLIRVQARMKEFSANPDVNNADQQGFGKIADAIKQSLAGLSRHIHPPQKNGPYPKR